MCYILIVREVMQYVTEELFTKTIVAIFHAILGLHSVVVCSNDNWFRAMDHHYTYGVLSVS